jgi:hypothetical protein
LISGFYRQRTRFRLQLHLYRWMPRRLYRLHRLLFGHLQLDLCRYLQEYLSRYDEVTDLRVLISTYAASKTAIISGVNL